MIYCNMIRTCSEGEIRLHTHNREQGRINVFFDQSVAAKRPANTTVTNYNFMKLIWQTWTGVLANS